MHDTKQIKVRNYSADICDIFEELLDRYNITIPSKDRVGDIEEARLFGTEYAEIEDNITDILYALIRKVKRNPEAEINVEEY